MRRASPLWLGPLLAALGCGPSATPTPCETVSHQIACVFVTIPRGATLEVAIDSLAAHGIIGHPRLFAFYARARGLRNALKSGTYGFDGTGQPSWNTLVDKLSRGRGALVRFTVREGLMLNEIADQAAAQFSMPRDSFLAAARDSDAIRGLELPAGTPNLEGYLYPTTYTISARPTAADLVAAMVDEFRGHWLPEWQSRLDSVKMTRHQVITLASIIEAEVRYAPDRDYVSAVYHNRLARGMKLQADPTVVYAKGHRLHRVYERTLLTSSPYNTYLHPGLPPGPICQPDSASIHAALFPAPVPYLYFVAQPDGKHIFSVSYAEHLKAIQTVKQQQRAARAPRPPDRRPQTPLP